MAIKLMAASAARLPQLSDHRIALVHRLGRMLIGETSVVVIVTSAHRKAAFAAALEGINRLKRVVPIWKKSTSRTAKSGWKENGTAMLRWLRAA
jgi:molybdopterin synthase catalytic subunit